MLACLCLPAGGAEPVQPPATLPELRQQISRIIDQPRYRAALWGVKIVRLDTKKTLFERNAEKLFSPASNSKLYTMALVLDTLGPDYRIRTSLYAKEKPDAQGTLNGDLIVFGRGDPTVNLRLHGGSIHQALAPLVTALTNAGVRRITGDVIGDDSYFHGAPFGSGWEWEDLEGYSGAEISALSINDNALTLAVRPDAQPGAPCRIALAPATTHLRIVNRTRTGEKGSKRQILVNRPVGENTLYVSGGLSVDDAAAFTESVTVHNPAGLFAALFRETLVREGITVSGGARSLNWLDREAQPADFSALVELGAVESPPLRALLPEVLKPSQNLYTDLLLAHLGMARPDGEPLAAGETSEQAGIKVLRAFLASAGIARGEVLLNEGSGLSRNNLVTPNATVELLEFMSRHRWAEIYSNSLPVAGVDGTLRRRMKGTVAEGNVRAKTGTLAAANSLAGYVRTAAGERLVFCLMLNRFQGPEADHLKTADLDAIAVLLAGFNGHTEP